MLFATQRIVYKVWKIIVAVGNIPVSCDWMQLQSNNERGYKSVSCIDGMREGQAVN